MKIPSIFRPSQSISSRLTWRVTTTVFVIMAVVSALLYALLWAMGLFLAAIIFQGTIKTSSEHANSVLTAVEVAVANNVPEVEAQLNTPDRIPLIADRILRLNPNIVGSCVAFEPDVIKAKANGALFAPYAYRNGQTIEIKQLSSPSYDYLHQEWYTKPKETGKDYWSAPYFDKDGGNIAMTTYSLPLFDSDDHMYAVITADISLDWIADMVAEADSISLRSNYEWFGIGNDEDEDTLYCFIISSDGTFIAHPDKKRVLNSNIFDQVKKTDSKKDDTMAEDMVAGRRGISSLKENGIDYICFYAPIEHTGWSMAIAIPQNEMLEVGKYLGLIAVVLMAIGLCVVFIVCYRSIHSATKPLRRFATSADEIADGNLQAELPKIKTRDEMGRLYDSFKTMQQSLVRLIDETKTINAEKGRIEGELQTARSIQMSMLPKTFPPYPDRDDIDIFAQLTPAKEVGGDLYDFFLRDEKLFFCIGDVSGKGVPASLVMAVTRTLFRTVSAHESNPAKIVCTINDVMASNNESAMFVTLFLGVLDLPTGRLRYCNAGHCAPLLIGTGVGMLNTIPNVPVGIMGGFRFENQEVIVNRDTSIFLYTDGLTEAEDIRQTLFDDERMMQTARSIYDQGDYQPATIVSQMTAAVKAFVGQAEQSDDLTLMAIQYKKEQEEPIRLQRSLTLPNDIEAVPQLNEFIDVIAEEIGLDMSLTMSLNLAIEEAVVNVMNYAYPQGVQGDVTIEAIADAEWLSFIISDSGTPFDPTAKEEADTTLSVEERPIGGLGIFLVRQLMDSINYERTGGKNILTVRKRLTGSTETEAQTETT